MVLLVIKFERKYLMDNKLIDNNYNIDSLFDNIKDMVNHIKSVNKNYSVKNMLLYLGNKCL